MKITPNMMSSSTLTARDSTSFRKYQKKEITQKACERERERDEERERDLAVRIQFSHLCIPFRGSKPPMIVVKMQREVLKVKENKNNFSVKIKH